MRQADYSERSSHAQRVEILAATTLKHRISSRTIGDLKALRDADIVARLSSIPQAGP